MPTRREVLFRIGVGLAATPLLIAAQGDLQAGCQQPVYSPDAEALTKRKLQNVVVKDCGSLGWQILGFDALGTSYPRQGQFGLIMKINGVYYNISGLSDARSALLQPGDELVWHPKIGVAVDAIGEAIATLINE